MKTNTNFYGSLSSLVLVACHCRAWVVKSAILVPPHRLRPLDSASNVHTEVQVWENLCSFVGVEPAGRTRLDTSTDGIRGVYMNEDIQEGDEVFSIPLDCCLRDDRPPKWMKAWTIDQNLQGEIDRDDQWATRLAAALLDLQLRNEVTDTEDPWLELLPDPKALRASLPIHWDEDVMLYSECSALELTVDSAFFARAQAGENLRAALEYLELSRISEESADGLADRCRSALDIVQTRSCRVHLDNTEKSPVVRLLAPVFDFLNHNVPCNAHFGVEGNERLVVRAIRNISANEEVFIDYGSAASPGWKCLSSYGFVPRVQSDDDEAEVTVNGVRYYPITPTSVPEDLVAAVGSSPEAEGEPVEFTSNVALRVGEILSNSAKVLEPEGDVEAFTGSRRISFELASALRDYHRMVLLECTRGLRSWAESQS